MAETNSDVREGLINTIGSILVIAALIAIGLTVEVSMMWHMMVGITIVAMIIVVYLAWRPR